MKIKTIARYYFTLTMTATIKKTIRSVDKDVWKFRTLMYSLLDYKMIETNLYNSLPVA